MTLFIKLEEGSPVGHPIVEQNFRRIFPRTSFPKYFTPDLIEPLGYGLYDYSSEPEVGRYEKTVEVSPVKSASGIWRQTWQVVDMTDEEKLSKDEQKSEEARLQRNWKLTDSDWTQLPDAPVDSTAWATYRQALRDITDHANFPYLNEEDWPTKPE